MANQQKIIFHRTTFLQSYTENIKLPEDVIPEIAIAGRSNAGKSSLINNITQQKKLARTSQTPGRTREINFFALFNNQDENYCARLVDLPGYGYAKVNKTLKKNWQNELTVYLSERVNLKILLIILDSRMPPTDLDFMLIEMMAKREICQIFIFNKVDKLNQSEKKKLHTTAEKLIYNVPNSHYVYYSSPRNIGKDILESYLNNIL